VNDYEQARLRRARAMDRGALTAIYDEYHPPLYRYIYHQVGEAETARDLTAELFQQLLQALHRGDGPTQNLRAWLYRVAHNLVVDYFRRQQHHRHLPLKEELVSQTPNPVELAEKNFAAAQIRSALTHLTPDQRQVIILKFLEEFSNEETASLLDKPVGAVKSLQHRALAALERYLNRAKEKML
jgi:RNA polymerase sigma-70 factor (ECF subfamily)